MKNIQARLLACMVALGTMGCQAEAGQGEGSYAVGVERTTSSGIVRTAAGTYEGYGRLLLSDDYSGVSYLDVLKTGFDITDTSQAASPHTVRVWTSSDSEEFTTPETLDELESDVWCCDPWGPVSGMGGSFELSPGEAPQGSSVTLGFPAVASSNPVSNNGILEVDPHTQDELNVKWQVRREGTLLESQITLSQE